jgi:hypothetical protein
MASQDVMDLQSHFPRPLVRRAWIVNDRSALVVACLSFGPEVRRISDAHPTILMLSIRIQDSPARLGVSAPFAAFAVWPSPPASAAVLPL